MLCQNVGQCTRKRNVEARLGTHGYYREAISISYFVYVYCAGGKIENNRVEGGCGAYGRENRCAQGSGGETLGKETIGEIQT